MIQFSRCVGFTFALILAMASSTEYANSSNESLVNQLKDHSAPYLALHGEDPVAWQEWGEEAVELARTSNKILYLSIGYFSCHWCHVMQQETYKDAKVAAYLNENFIPVKIDKELEPALDRRLMGFTQRIIGRGGWPLNVFISPNGYPIYSVLYAPTTEFFQVISRMQAVWNENPEKVLELVSNEVVENFPDALPKIDNLQFGQILTESVPAILSRADSFDGGFGNQQKFPSVPQLRYLLDRYSQHQNPELKKFLLLTLSSMANRGLYDHLAGGFFRYSVDPGWEIPHFEKMLYDNVNLGGLYLQAAEALNRSEFEVIGHETLSFLSRRMWHADGALISSFSAVDDENIEGGSYLWTKDEIEEILTPAELDLAVSVWDLDRPSELPAGNHLRFAKSLSQYAQEKEVSLGDVETHMQSVKSKLLAVRDDRSLPLDDKLVTGWNALALSTFTAAAQRYSDKGYEEVAKKLRNFLLDQMWDGKRLYRSIVKGKKLGSASLEDYAYTASALLAWSNYSGNENDADVALTIARLGWDKFHRHNGWYQGDDALLAVVSGEEVIADASTASPSANLVEVSLKLARRFNDTELEHRALSALNRGELLLSSAAFWYVGQLSAIGIAISAD